MANIVYNLQQLTQNYNDNVGDKYLETITTGTAKKIIGYNPDDYLQTLFENNCVKTNTFVMDESYYFHGKILRLDSEQEFTIKLINEEKQSTADSIEQYVKTIKINPRSNTDRQYDIEFMFTPLGSELDTILFDLKRVYPGDFSSPRNPIIGYEELSKVKNQNSIFASNQEIIKLGIQAKPSTVMCINHESIRVPKSGIQEMKDGFIPIKFFSVVNGGKETNDNFKNQMTDVESGIETTSECFFNQTKQRYVNAFALDYITKQTVV